MSLDIITVPTEGSAHSAAKRHNISTCAYVIMSLDMVQQSERKV